MVVVAKSKLRGQLWLNNIVLTRFPQDENFVPHGMKRVGDDAGIQKFSPGDEIDDPRERSDSTQHVQTTKSVYEHPPRVNKVSDIGQIVLAGKVSTSVIDDGRDVEVSTPKRTDGYLPL